MRTSAVIAAAIAGALVSGCVSYSGITNNSDEKADESNQAFAADAHKAFVARMKAPPRPVVVVEAPEMALFLDPSKSQFGGDPLCNDISVRKEIALAFKSQLRNKVATIKDFRLVDDVQAMVAVGAEAVKPATYRLTYNITSLSLTGVSGIAKVEIRLFAPDGANTIFSFIGDGTCVNAQLAGGKQMLIGAVEEAAEKAMRGYARKFGPPIFVTDTCQGGQFARINVGSKFGVYKGQLVEFYRNKVRKGVTGEDEIGQQVVGTGIVGDKNAPIEEDGAWVFVENFDEDNRTVFRWTSARVITGQKAGLISNISQNLPAL